MKNTNGDMIIVAGLAVLVLGMAGVIGFEVWNRNRPAAPTTVPASAPARPKAKQHPQTPQQAPAPDPGAKPSWERMNG